MTAADRRRVSVRSLLRSQRGGDGRRACLSIRHRGVPRDFAKAIQDVDGAASRASLELEVRIAKQALEPDRRQVAARPITA